MSKNFRSGLVAIVGRPNVGKSTLMNHLIGQKLSITSRRPQTTRHRILGVATHSDAQVVYVDTPGIHSMKGRPLNRFMNRAATGSLEGVDCILFVISAKEPWASQDLEIVKLLERAATVPVILVINKIDQITDQASLLPLLDDSRKRYEFSDMVPVSALKATNLDVLENVIKSKLPEQEAIYPTDQLTDRSERFLVSELIREQVFRQVGQEIPYSVAVGVDQFKEDQNRLVIDATLYVEKKGQKAILIGQGGARIKSIGQTARGNISELLGKKVHLNLWVKVRDKWSDDGQMLNTLGYGEGDQ